MNDVISRQGTIDRQDTIDRINEYIEEYSEIDSDGNHSEKWCAMQEAKMTIENMPPAQSDIIRCNACKHWTQTTGNMPGFGLGDCDYLNAKLVNCNGYCYWAERREE